MAARQTEAALGLVNSLIGLRQWESLDDRGRLAALVGVYGQANVLSGEQLGRSTGLGSLQGVGAALGLLSALDRGDEGAAIINAIGLGDALGAQQASQAIARALNLSAGAADTIIPGLGFALALESGDPVSIVASGLQLYGALAGVAWAGPVGIAVALLATVVGRHSPPMAIGVAQAGWDDSGALTYEVLRQQQGGEAEAQAMLAQLTEGVRDGVREHMPGFDVIPGELPTLHIARNASGDDRHPYALTWTDDNGQPQVRYYDSQSRVTWHEQSTGTQGPLWSGAADDYPPDVNQLNYDFLRLAQHYALAPAWQVEGLRQQWVVHSEHGVADDVKLATLRQRPALQDLLLDAQLSEDGQSQTLAVIALGLPEPGLARPNVLVNLDDDPFLESTRWLQAHQAVLGLDLDGDGQLAARELLGGELGLLDMNHDGRLDGADPVFAALRLWVDVNGDGISGSAQGDEARSLAQAGILAIVFDAQGVRIERDDGSVEWTSMELLTGERFGALWALGEGAAVGLTEAREQADGSARLLFHAANLLADAIPIDDEAEFADDLVESGDGRMSGAAPPRTLAQERREVTAAMIRSARNSDLLGGSGAALTALALGAGGAAFAAQADPGAPRELAEGSQPLPTGAPGGMPSLAEALATGVPASAVSVAAQAARDREAGEGAGGERLGFDARSEPLVTLLTPVASDPLGGRGLIDSWPAPAGLSSQGSTPLGSQAAATPVAVGSTSVATLPAAGAPATLGEVPNLAPRVSGEGALTDEDTPLVLRVQDLLANDHDADGDPLAIVRVGQAQHGAVGLTPEGDVQFIPDADYHGPASFIYWVSDGRGGTSPATVNLTIGPVNDAPLVQGEEVDSVEDQALLFDPQLLLANEVDIDGDHLVLTGVDAAQHGRVEIITQADGSERILFTPDADYFGPAQFRYTVNDGQTLVHGHVGLQIAPVNDAPAVAGESFDGAMETRYTFTQAALLANDRDVETPEALRIVRVEGAQHGAVVLTDTGVVFEPDPDYFGPASFDYVVADAEGAQSVATMQLHLAHVNHAPHAGDDAFSVSEDPGVVVIGFDQLLANDTDRDQAAMGDRLDISAIAPTEETAGHFELDVPGRRVLYQPTADWSGEAAFAYTLSDGAGGSAQGRAVVSVHAVNDAPRITSALPAPGQYQGQVTAVDGDGPQPLSWSLAAGPDRGQVLLDSHTGAWQYDPQGQTGGSTSFYVRVSDGEASSVQTLQMQLPESPPPPPPVDNDGGWDGLGDNENDGSSGSDGEAGGDGDSGGGAGGGDGGAGDSGDSGDSGDGGSWKPTPALPGPCAWASDAEIVRQALVFTQWLHALQPGPADEPVAFVPLHEVSLHPHTDFLSPLPDAASAPGALMDHGRP